MDLKRLLHISQARTDITEALLTIAEPLALVTAINGILAATHASRDCALFIDLPDVGWTMWGRGQTTHVHRTPPADWPQVSLPGSPPALLSIHTDDDEHPDADLMAMLEGLASTIRPAIDQYLHDARQSRRVTDLRHAALTDPLTGLGNRRGLDARLPVGQYSLIAVDLDHFKNVNDLFGHAAGDSVLAQVASVMAAAVRRDDAVFRVGGEEFLVVLPYAPEARALEVAERIRLAVAGLDLHDQAPAGRMTVSLGVTAVTGGDEAAFARALATADAALYLAKNSGRDQVATLPTDPDAADRGVPPATASAV
jgi:diguanylate cyclase (GGDEF)-like protein